MSMEFFRTDPDTGKSIETMLFSFCTGATLLKNYCVTVNREKLAKNIDSAIDDWVEVQKDAEARKIMKKYAFWSRIFTSSILWMANICTVLYIMAVFFLNDQGPSDALDLDANATEGNFFFSFYFNIPY